MPSHGLSSRRSFLHKPIVCKPSPPPPPDEPPPPVWPPATISLAYETTWNDPYSPASYSWVWELTQQNENPDYYGDSTQGDWFLLARWLRQGATNDWKMEITCVAPYRTLSSFSVAIPVTVGSTHLYVILDGPPWNPNYQINSKATFYF